MIEGTGNFFKKIIISSTGRYFDIRISCFNVLIFKLQIPLELKRTHIHTFLHVYAVYILLF